MGCGAKMLTRFNLTWPEAVFWLLALASPLLPGWWMPITFLAAVVWGFVLLAVAFTHDWLARRRARRATWL